MSEYIMILAIIGHLLCGICDCLLSYNGNRRIDFKCMEDAQRMRIEFEGMPLSAPLKSIILGTFAITMFGFGYLELSRWMNEYSHVCSVIMYISSLIFLISIVTHHIICGLVEWFYIRLNRTYEAKEVVLEFQQKTSITMFVGYAALAVFLVTLFVAIVLKMTCLPRYAAVFNTAIGMLLLAPTKLPAKGNVAGVFMFMGLLIGYVFW